MKGGNALQAAGAMVKHAPFACANARMPSDATIFLAKASDATICLAKASDATICLANLAKDKAKVKDKARAKG